MIGMLQRLGHRETVLGFLGWSVFALIVMQVSASLLPAPLMRIPVYAALATVMLGVIMGRNIASRGRAPAFAVVGLNALPLAISGAVVTAFAPHLGWSLLAAPFLLAVGATIAIVQQRRIDGYQNPGSALAGAAAATFVFAMEASLALGAMDARFGQGVIEVNSYLAEYDCLDPQRAQLAGVIHSLGSEHNRQRIDNALDSDDPMHARPCKP
jgi:hypothetical protein